MRKEEPMIWSKKQRLFRELLAPSLARRLAIHSAAYRAAYEERGRTWITLDGEEILSFCDFVEENAWLAAGRPAEIPQDVLSKRDFGISFGIYLHLDIDAALSSDDPVVQGLAFLDRRIGKRRLVPLDENLLPEPAKTLLRVRRAAEGLASRSDRTGTVA